MCRMQASCQREEFTRAINKMCKEKNKKENMNENQVTNAARVCLAKKHKKKLKENKRREVAPTLPFICEMKNFTPT